MRFGCEQYKEETHVQKYVHLSVNKKNGTRVPGKEGGCGWAAVAATAAAADVVAAAVAAAPAEAAVTTTATAAAAGATAAAAGTAAVAAGTATAAAACSGLPPVPCSSFVVGRKGLGVAKNGREAGGGLR